MGTENSLWLARKINQHTSAKIIPIALTLNEDSIYKEIVGIITPVYYGDLPNIVKNFLNKLRNIENNYIFLVVNYEGGAGVSVSTAKKLIKKKGGNISAVYSIHMPQNAFYKQSENHQILYASADKLLKTINTIIAKRRKGRFSTNRVMDVILETMAY